MWLVLLFILLQPGFLVEIPSKKIWMTGHTSTTAVLVHAAIFAALFALFLYFVRHWAAGAAGAAAAAGYEGFSSSLPVSKMCRDVLMEMKIDNFNKDTVPKECNDDKKNATIFVNTIVTNLKALTKIEIDSKKIDSDIKNIIARLTVKK